MRLDINRDGRFTNEDVKYIIALILIVTGVGMLISAFWVEPIAQIHTSISYVFAMILTFVGSVLGIDAHYSYMFNKYKVETTSKVSSSE